MATIVIPRRNIENLRGDAGDKPFPAGPWKGVIREVRTKELPSRSDGTPFAGYETTDGEILTILLGHNEALDGQDDVGERVFFVDLPIRDGLVDVTTIDQNSNTNSWQVQRAQRTLGNLATALDQVEMTDDAIGINDGFVEALAQGQFDGTVIGFTVYHRKVKDRTYAEIETFFSV